MLLQRQGQTRGDKMKLEIVRSIPAKTIMYKRIAKEQRLPSKITVPKKIFQTWHSLHLPPKMAQAARSVQESHPDFQYTLFDDSMCRQFIQTHFPPDVLHAFDSLIPGAYKADLWRYCVLFIEGGIYLDIKYCCESGFTFHELLSRNHFVYDQNFIHLYNACIVTAPNNMTLRRCIRKIVHNVKTKFYGANILSPTGPDLLRQCLPPSAFSSIVLYHVQVGAEKYILWRGALILKMVAGYYAEQDNHKKEDHYLKLWESRNIYRNVRHAGQDVGGVEG